MQQDQFKTISGLLNTSNEALKASVYLALPFVSTSHDLPKLIDMLSKENNAANIEIFKKLL